MSLRSLFHPCVTFFYFAQDSPINIPATLELIPVDSTGVGNVGLRTNIFRSTRSVVDGLPVHHTEWVDSYHERVEKIVFLPEYYVIPSVLVPWS
jgi:hypothetical protein